MSGKILSEAEAGLVARGTGAYALCESHESQRALLKQALAALLRLNKATADYFVLYGAEHSDDDCPGDADCECPEVVALNAAHKDSDAALCAAKQAEVMT
jgi:hypothetical protein